MDYKKRLQNELTLFYEKTKKRYNDYYFSLRKLGKINANDFSEEEKHNIAILNSRIATIEYIQNLVNRLK